MRTKDALLVVVLLIPATALLAQPQSVADVARAARENRLKVTKDRSVRTWTNDDFPKRPTSESPTGQTGTVAAPPPQTEQAAASTPSESGSPSTEAPSDKRRTREYWQGRFKAARQKLADDEEQQRLVEDELSLLRLQQAREISPDVQSELESKLKAKTTEVEVKRTQTAKSKKEVDDLERDFKESGAPEEWSKTD